MHGEEQAEITTLNCVYMAQTLLREVKRRLIHDKCRVFVIIRVQKSRLLLKKTRSINVFFQTTIKNVRSISMSAFILSLLEAIRKVFLIKDSIVLECTQFYYHDL